MVDSLYRCFEKTLALIDHLAETKRCPIMRILVWWITWAERLATHASDRDPDCTC